jgi:hypothetical protein
MTPAGSYPSPNAYAVHPGPSILDSRARRPTLSGRSSPIGEMPPHLKDAVPEASHEAAITQLTLLFRHEQDGIDQRALYLWGTRHPALAPIVAMLEQLASNGVSAAQIRALTLRILQPAAPSLGPRFSGLAQIFLATPVNRSTRFSCIKELIETAERTPQASFDALCWLGQTMGAEMVRSTLDHMQALSNVITSDTELLHIHACAQALGLDVMPLDTRQEVGEVLVLATSQERLRLERALMRPSFTPTLRATIIMGGAMSFGSSSMCDTIEKLVALPMAPHTILGLLEMLQSEGPERAVALLDLATLVGRTQWPWGEAHHAVLDAAMQLTPGDLALLTDAAQRPIFRHAQLSGIAALVAMAPAHTCFAWMLAIWQTIPDMNTPTTHAPMLTAMLHLPAGERETMTRLFAMLTASNLTGGANPHLFRLAITLPFHQRTPLLACVNAWQDAFEMTEPASFARDVLRSDLLLGISDLILAGHRHAFLDPDMEVLYQAVDHTVGLLTGLNDEMVQPGEMPLAYDAMTPVAHGVDEENVMNHVRQRHTDASIAKIQALFAEGGGVNRNRNIINVGLYISHLAHRQGADAQTLSLSRIRGGATEKENALRVLAGQAHPQDFTLSLTHNPSYTMANGEQIGLGDLTAMVWHGIGTHQSASGDKHTTLLEQDLMRHSLVLALAQSIEDDGHRVCGQGLSQRLVVPLQGYVEGLNAEIYVTPAEFFRESAHAFARSMMNAEPTALQFASFRRETLAQAAKQWNANSPFYREVVQQMDQWEELLIEQ